MKNAFVFAGFCLLVIVGCSRADKPNAQNTTRSEASSAAPSGRLPSTTTPEKTTPAQEVATAPANGPLTPPSASHFLLGKKGDSASSHATSPESGSGSQSIVMPPPVPPPPKVPPREPMASSSPWTPPSPSAAPNPATDISANAVSTRNPLRGTAAQANPTGGASASFPRARITGLSANPFRAAPKLDSDPGDTNTFTTRSLYSAAPAPTPPSPGPSIDDRSFVPNVPQTSPQTSMVTQFDANPSPKVEGASGGVITPSALVKAAGAIGTDKPKHKHQHGKQLPSTARATENSLVKVFYGTDRKVITAAERALDNREFWGYVISSLVVLSLVIGSIAIARGQPPRSIGFGLTVIVCFLALGYAALTRISDRVVVTSKGKCKKIEYGSERGDLQLGICEVSIPKNHQAGKIELPSIFRIEFTEDKDRHVVLERTVQKSEAEFYQQLQNKVNNSPRKDLFVFIHGYNETFEDAALRTAQMAFDLGFEGAPIFYSWPSKGDLLGYSYDENNVAWTVPHLKKFLVNLAKNSDAKAVNLIAHSMGNRALTSALKELALEVHNEKAVYNEVILAAPDIDADTFKNDIAPYITKSANRVTLYASSRDKALEASQLVHGYPRAGDSGDRLMIISGIETIDVSEIDTTLLGHTYISGNEPIIHDLTALLRDAHNAALRPWLKAIRQNDSSYWVFTRDAATASLATPPR